MKGRKKFAFDIGITFFASTLAMLVGFVITLLLGRYLGADDLGLYRMIYTIYGIAVMVVTIGTPAAIIKYVAQYKENKYKFNQIVSSGIITSLFLGIGFTIVFYFSSGIFAAIFNMPELSNLLKILSPVFPFALVNGVLLGLLNGIREMKKYAAATILQSILMVIITLTLIYFGFGAAGAVVGVVLSTAVSCMFLILISRSYFEITFHNYVLITKKILSFGAQIVGADAINMINYQADVILIGYFLTAKDVGYYAVAVGLSRLIWLIPQAVQKITYPATSEYWTKNNHISLQMMIDKSMKYTSFILLPVGVGLGFFAKEIIILIFGTEFIFAVLPVQILIVGTVIFGLVKAIGGSLSGIGRVDINLKVTGFGAMTNIVLNFLLIPTYGIAGAAIATITSFIIIAILFIYLTTSIMQIKIDLRWYGLVTIITAMFVSAFLLNTNYYVNLLLFGIYCFVFVNLIKKEDRKTLKSLIFPLLFRTK